MNRRSRHAKENGEKLRKLIGMLEKEVFHETVVDDMSIYVLRRTAPKQWVNVINKLYRRSAVGSIRFRKGLRFEEDFFFNYEVNAAIRRKVLVPGVDYVYRTNPDSATVTLNLRRYFDSASERIRLSCEVFWKAGRNGCFRRNALKWRKTAAA